MVSGEMAQLVKSSPCEKDLSSMPSTHVCVYSVVMCSCDPGAREAERDGSLELVGQIASAAWKVPG